MLNEKLRTLLLEQKDPFKDIVGQERIKKDLKSALLCERNIIVVGPPGIGKTTLAKNIAKLDSGIKNFVRVQGSPDLTVEDILGDIDPAKALKHGASSIEAFVKGKIFKADKGILFFDELNRCPEKLQNALLQVLEEGKATISNYEVDFDLDFVFIATMNPEDSSTEKLSDVLLDRFDVIYMGYPEKDSIEKAIVVKRGKRLCDIDEKLLSVLVRFVRSLREGKELERKPSVRATIGLYERCQANALIDGRTQANIDDLQAAIISVLSHRIKLKPSVKYIQNTVDYLKKQFSQMDKEELPIERADAG